jgi:molybdenum cofactor cytidylyltransferase
LDSAFGLGVLYNGPLMNLVPAMFSQKTRRELLFSGVNDPLDAVLLAAGFSRRYGPDNKLIAIIDGKPLARHTLDLVTGLQAKGVIRRIFFVSACAEVAALAEGLPVTLVHNPHPELGQQMSIRLALEAASQDSAAYYLFCPCDQPHLTPAAVERIFAARSPGCIVEPRIDGQPASPKLFPASLVPELLALPPHTPPRTLLATHMERVIPVDFPESSASLFFDIDYR